MYNHYNHTLKENARELRTQSVSMAEKRIWKSLLSRNKMGVKFKRQRPIYNFIVDFFCQEIKLIIEIDGSSHLNNSKYDKFRQDKLESLGYNVVRFGEGEVINCLDDIHQQLTHIIYCLKEGNKR
ncbi:MAG: DUF559 domain-containing protein [Crocinitomicaceae bacterium]|nr:DUF559 domain-containing protein [Crocinitomicaceae bacterium]